MEGWGEADPSRYYGETADTVLAMLRRLEPHLPTDPFNLDAAALTVGDILWARTAAGHVSDGIHETLERLIATGSDALPIVDSDGNLAGVVLVDDLLRALAET